MRFHGVSTVVIGTLMLTGSVRAVVSVPAVIPVSDSSSVFDVSHAGNTYTLGAATSLNPAGFDVRDLFGGQFDSYAPERSAIVFADQQPHRTVEVINVTLATPVALQSYAAYLSADANQVDRSTSEFRLYAGNTLLDDVTILDESGTQTYGSVYGGNGFIEVSNTLSNAPVSAAYTLEFVQNAGQGVASGIRANEFEGFVPEPTCLSLGGFCWFALMARRRSLPRM